MDHSDGGSLVSDRSCGGRLFTQLMEEQAQPPFPTPRQKAPRARISCVLKSASARRPNHVCESWPSLGSKSLRNGRSGSRTSPNHCYSEDEVRRCFSVTPQARFQPIWCKVVLSRAFSAQSLATRSDRSTWSRACRAYSGTSTKLFDFSASVAHPTTRCGWLGKDGNTFGLSL